MPRPLRVEYENACYHVMASGINDDPIVFDDDDRELFVRTFFEAVERCGWEVLAWVLLDDHYHLIFRTPQPNLVEGMQWMQNVYIRRINAKRDMWGRLFKGRYRAIVIQNQEDGESVWQDYLRAAIDYVHLKPGRVGLVDGDETSVLDYPWSSMAQGMNKPPTKRPTSLQVTEVLDLFGQKDQAAGRKKMAQRYDRWIREEADTDPEVDGISYAKRVERGWCWGSRVFKASLVKKFASKPQRSSREFQSSKTTRELNEQKAQQIILQAEAHFGKPIEELKEVKRGDWTRAAIGWAIWKQTIVSHKWIAEAVNLKSSANSSLRIRSFVNTPDEELPLKLRKWRKLINAT